MAGETDRVAEIEAALADMSTNRQALQQASAQAAKDLKEHDSSVRKLEKDLIEAYRERNA